MPKPMATTLLAGADFMSVAAHPSEPLLAVGTMTPSGEGEGQIVVWDTSSGQAIGATFDEHGFGFEPAEDMLRWAPTGRRIAAAAGTNAVMVVLDGRILMNALPDDGRDHVVDFCWLGNADTLYAAAFGQEDGAGGGAVMHVRAADGALRWLRKDAAPQILSRLVYNPAICAVVGDNLNFAFGIDAANGKLLYQVSLAEVLPRPTISSKAAWSKDGRSLAVVGALQDALYVRATGRMTGGQSPVNIFNGDNGQLQKSLTLPGEVAALSWGPSNAGGTAPLAVVTQLNFRDPRHLHLIVDEAVTLRLEAELAVASYKLPDAKTVAFSQDGKLLALLLRDGTVRIVDVATGKSPMQFFVKAHANAAAPEGLLWSAGGQLVAVHRRGLSLWDLGGQLIGRAGETG